MVAGGSYPQAMTDRKEKRHQKRNRKGTRRLIWADCDDEEEKENHEGQETEGDKEKEEREEVVKGEKGTGQEEVTDKKTPGLEANVESEPEMEEEERKSGDEQES